MTYTKHTVRNQVKSDVNKHIIESDHHYQLYRSIHIEHGIADISGYNMTDKFTDSWILLLSAIGKKIKEDGV